VLLKRGPLGTRTKAVARATIVRAVVASHFGEARPRSVELVERTGRVIPVQTVASREDADASATKADTFFAPRGGEVLEIIEPEPVGFWIASAARPTLVLDGIEPSTRGFSVLIQDWATPRKCTRIWAARRPTAAPVQHTKKRCLRLQIRVARPRTAQREWTVEEW
jgi:hypothetical protein